MFTWLVETTPGWGEAIAAGRAIVTDGPQTDVDLFFSYFETLFGTPIQLVVR
jgi:hypothetical protein